MAKNKQLVFPDGLGNATPEEVPQGVTFTSDSGVLQEGTKDPNSGKSLILPDNISHISVVGKLDGFDITWIAPENSEVEIEKFNLYIAKKSDNPTKLSDYDKIAELPPDATTYTVEGLESGIEYCFVVESVSVEGYENASLRGVREQATRAGYWLMIAGRRLWYSENGETWASRLVNNGTNLYLSEYANPMISVSGKFYYLSIRTITEFDPATNTTKTVGIHSSAYDSAECLKVGSTRATSWANRGDGMEYCYGHVTKTGINAFIAFGNSVLKPYAFDGGAYERYLVVSGNLPSYYVLEYDVNENFIHYGSQTVDGDHSSGMAHGLGRWVMCRRDGYSYYVLDKNLRVNYKTVEMSGYNSFNKYIGKVIFVEDWQEFYAVCGDGCIRRSEDGVTWVQSSQSLSAYYNYGSLSYGNGRLIYSANGNDSYYTLNGRDWIAMTGCESSGVYHTSIASLY